MAFGGAPAFAYQIDKDALPRPDVRPDDKRAGYLHPMHTPAGTLGTVDWPARHVHHHGSWAPWISSTFQGLQPVAPPAP